MHKLMEAYIKTVLLPAGRGRVGIKAAPIVLFISVLHCFVAAVVPCRPAGAPTIASG
jgi:hypothetical protein